MLSILFYLLKIRSKQGQIDPSVYNERFDRAMNDFDFGKVGLSQSFFNDFYASHRANPRFREKHIEFLISIGEYEKIIELYPDIDSGLRESLAEKIKIMKLNDNKEVSKLFTTSKYNFKVLKSTIKLHLLSNNLGEAEKALEIAKKNYEGNVVFKELSMQYYFLYNLYNKGLEILKSMGKEVAVQTFIGYYNEYTSAKKAVSGLDKIKGLNSLYQKISTEALVDEFSPSIYTGLKFVILNDLISYVVEYSVDGYFYLAKVLYDKKGDEKSLFFYIMCLVNDNKIDQAELLMNQNSFNNYNFIKRLESRIAQKKEEKENEGRKKAEEKQRQEERKRQESHQRRGQQRQYQPRQGRNNDALGYYKALGVTPNASVSEIKTGYNQKLREIRKKYGKDKQKLEKEHLIINKARDVLTNEKKKEMYDAGYDPEQTQGGGYRGGNSRHHGGYSQGQMFEEFGDFSDFFRAFRNFGGSGQSRTQFVFF